MEIETAVARHGRRRRLSVTGQGSGNAPFHSSDDSANCFIARIPETILSEIFLKLGVESLIRCRRVCKSWRRIIFSQLFAQSFQATRPDPIVISRSGKLFYFFQCQELSVAAISSYHQKRSTSACSSSPPVLHLVNSCNGLLCMTICSGIVWNPEGHDDTCSLFKCRCHGKTVFIVNPITNEYIALPSCGQGMRMDLCGLGFCAQTNQFKALRILSKKSDDYCSRVVQVYTLGSSNWRSIDVDIQSLNRAFPQYNDIHMFSFVNGSLYWINNPMDDVKLAAFDFAKERFLQVHPMLLDRWHLGYPTGLGTFKGCFSLCGLLLDIYHEDGPRYGVTLFLLKFNEDLDSEDWECEFDVGFPIEFRPNLEKDRVIQWFENGTILLWMDDYLYLFVMETGEFKKFSECMIRSEEDVVVHVPSFLSLKDVVKGQSSMVQKLGSHKGHGNELDVVVQKAKSLAELQDDAVLREALLREKEEEIRVLHQRLSRLQTRWVDSDDASD